MSWHDVLEVAVEILGEDAAADFEAACADRLAGSHCYIPQRKRLTRSDVDAVSPGRPKEAARQLGVHQSTVYRAIHRTRVIR